MKIAFDALLARCVAEAASDLHLSAGAMPMLRLRGELRAMLEPLTSGQLAGMAQAVLAPEQWQRLQAERGLDIAYTLASGERFRINLYFERGQPAFAIRRLNASIRSVQELHLPVSILSLTKFHDGLVLVTGPTGSGKSTTLAALIEEINRQQACHILTVEDPVEYLFQNQRALVHQRELGTDVLSFSDAVRAALREDPDVILVGEMRDLATMRTAVTAAETGHLVFSTLHTGDPVGAVDRIAGAFPAEEQNYVRQQLSLVLRAVVTQHLLPAKGGRGRVPVLEILMITPAVASLIRQNKPRQILSMMETGTNLGMQTLEQSLAQHVADGLIELDVARLMARDEARLDNLLALRQLGADAWR